MNSGKAIRFLFWNLEEILCCVLLGLMSVFSFLNVLSRYVMHFPINFADELNIYFFVWLTLLGSALAFRNGSHMCISILYDRFPNFLRKIVYLFVHTVIIVFFAALCYYGVLEVQDEMVLNAVTEVMQIPLWYFTIGAPIGSAWIVLRVFQKSFSDLKQGKY
ncbi:MAG: TRAP transporter small permease [Synergistaceae bacterium]|nr:TRAP transporter small permease [Synergistaceae bacterium]